jgi:hypothetical protein
MKKVNTKPSAKKKLIPAAGSLLISAAMLSTSTYAWFTMSKEVEVTGIKMTATVPENLEISLGDNTGLTDSSLTLGDGATEYRVKYTDITAPDGAANGSTDPATITNTTDWYNTVDFSEHYVAGKLKPVSSTDGNYLFKTTDAITKGKDVSNVATFATLTEDDEADLYALRSLTDNEGKRAGESTDRDFTIEGNLAEGYYIDFPVWFRTSAKANSNEEVNGTSGYVTTDTVSYLNLGVIANIKQRTASDASEDLFHAVRVAVLPSGSATSGMVYTDSTGVIANYSDYAAGTAETDPTLRYYDRYSDAGTDANHGAVPVKSADMSTLTTLANQAVYSNGSLIWNPSEAKVTNALSLYGGVDYVKQASASNASNGYFTDGESVVKVPLATDGKYGYSERYVIRVWLEGEDINCWNETAGQDWDISLRFVQLSNIADGNSSYAPATAHAGNNTAAGPAASGSLITASKNMTTGAPAATANAAVSVTFDGTTLSTSYTWDTNTYKLGASAKSWTDESMKWDSGTATKTVDTTTWWLADGTSFANESDFINYLNEFNGKYDLSTIKLYQTKQ